MIKKSHIMMAGPQNKTEETDSIKQMLICRGGFNF